jgi:hypothetical protein
MEGDYAAIARQQRGFHSNELIHNNRETVGIGVFYVVRAEAV